jgi:hypothetical protein
MLRTYSFNILGGPASSVHVGRLDLSKWDPDGAASHPHIGTVTPTLDLLVRPPLTRQCSRYILVYVSEPRAPSTKYD